MFTKKDIKKMIEALTGLEKKLTLTLIDEVNKSIKNEIENKVLRIEETNKMELTTSVSILYETASKLYNDKVLFEKVKKRFYKDIKNSESDAVTIEVLNMQVDCDEDGESLSISLKVNVSI